MILTFPSTDHSSITVSITLSSSSSIGSSSLTNFLILIISFSKSFGTIWVLSCNNSTVLALKIFNFVFDTGITLEITN